MKQGNRQYILALHIKTWLNDVVFLKVINNFNLISELPNGTGLKYFVQVFLRGECFQAGVG